jgi:hypothetical protein
MGEILEGLAGDALNELGLCCEFDLARGRRRMQVRLSWPLVLVLIAIAMAVGRRVVGCIGADT